MDDTLLLYGARMEYPLRGSVVEVTGTAHRLTCIDCGAGYTWGLYEEQPKGVAVMRAHGCYRCESNGLSLYECTTEVTLSTQLRCGVCGKLDGARQFDHHGIYAGIYCDACFSTPAFNSYRTYVPDEAIEEDV